jgi:flagellar M-ring protein FliF
VKNVTAAVLVALRPAPAGSKDAEPKRTPEEINMLRQLVVNALGLKAAPGQPIESLVTVEEVAFSAEPVTQEVQAIEKENRWMGWVDAGSHWGAVAAAAAIFLVFIRMLSRQRPEAVPVEILTMPPDFAARSRPTANGVTPDLLNDLIRQKPANVGATLRDWIAPNRN